jgi:predicted DNA-binding transcriptional regulator YafY
MVCEMRIERLLRILLLLQGQEQLSVRELAGRLGVSARTVQRDLDALSRAGVPVYSTRGRGGGWSLLPDYRTRLSGLTPAEAMTVFVGTTAHVLADLGLDIAADSALAKLISSLPPTARRDAEYARRRVLVDYAGWDGPGEASPWLAVCRQGLWEERLVLLRYGSSTTEVAVAPYGLVAKGRTWYLVARRPDGEVRTYRVPRIAQATLTNETFSRPDDFDLATHWDEACRTFMATRPSYRTMLRVRADAVHRLAWAPSASFDPQGEVDEGWREVAMVFENPFEARTFLLGMAGDAEVLEPAALREELRAAAARIADRHGQTSSRITTRS